MSNSKEIRYQLQALLKKCEPLIGGITVAQIEDLVDLLVLKSVNEETNTWVDLAMKGETVRNKIFLDAILAGAYNKFVPSDDSQDPSDTSK